MGTETKNCKFGKEKEKKTNKQRIAKSTHFQEQIKEVVLLPVFRDFESFLEQGNMAEIDLRFDISTTSSFIHKIYLLRF